MNWNLHSVRRAVVLDYYVIVFIDCVGVRTSGSRGRGDGGRSLGHGDGTKAAAHGECTFADEGSFGYNFDFVYLFGISRLSRRGDKILCPCST